MSTPMTVPGVPAQAAQPPAKGKGVLFFVCAGCLGCAVLAAIGATFLFFGVVKLMKSSEPYTVSLDRARTNPAVTTLIGEPLAEPFMVMGNINLENDNGVADLTYTVTGPAGSGTVHVVGTKSMGTWTYSVMEIDVNGQKIPLAH